MDWLPCPPHAVDATLGISTRDWTYESTMPQKKRLCRAPTCVAMACTAPDPRPCGTPNVNRILGDSVLDMSKYVPNSEQQKSASARMRRGGGAERVWCSRDAAEVSGTFADPIMYSKT